MGARSIRLRWWIGSESALLVIGALTLAIGMLVYLVDRPQGHVWLHATRHSAAPLFLFGTAGAWLPAFARTLAFSLFTAALWPARSALRYGAWAAWFVVNAAFGPKGVGRILADYFVPGSFGVNDLVAAALGAAIAASVVRVADLIEEKQHVL